MKKDVMNYIRTDLTSKYGLVTKHRERHLVAFKDIKYLLRRLFGDDSHDYRHERVRMQVGSGLSLFSGSAARAGSIVEFSSYRASNECLCYRHLSFHIKRDSNSSGVKRWVTIDPEFLKGRRRRNDKEAQQPWFTEFPILGLNFVFWVVAHGIVDHAFRGISTVADLLGKRPPKTRESWTLQWTDSAKNLPFFKTVNSQGPEANRALTFSSLRHNNTSLAQRDGFQDQIRVHGIRGGVANTLDENGSQAARSQGLDHLDPDSYHIYQSRLKRTHSQAAYYGLEPEYECRDMEDSMAHHRDPNVPHRLSASALSQFEWNEEIIEIDKRITELTERIMGQPSLHIDLTAERSQLYNRKAKRRRAEKCEYISSWWDASYDNYNAGSQMGEQHKTSLFDIYSKYMPERARLKENLFMETTIDSEIGRQCLEDMVALCAPTEKVAYYPGMGPLNGR